eukprot:c18860_g1_i3.p1 GENE.c18860_g1_i3~~c18860_g1_i3.p1  ORF type:complete len:435 (+),score=63.01 c18860_g1_i3:286-1590(+)
MGYRAGDGLGKDGSGRTAPIDLEIRGARRGLGSERPAKLGGAVSGVNHDELIQHFRKRKLGEYQDKCESDDSDGDWMRCNTNPEERALRKRLSMPWQFPELRFWNDRFGAASIPSQLGVLMAQTELLPRLSAPSEIISRLQPQFQLMFPESKVTLVGSFANDTAIESSYVDLVLESVVPSTTNIDSVRSCVSRVSGIRLQSRPRHEQNVAVVCMTDTISNLGIYLYLATRETQEVFVQRTRLISCHLSPAHKLALRTAKRILRPHVFDYVRQTLLPSGRTLRDITNKNSTPVPSYALGLMMLAVVQTKHGPTHNEDNSQTALALDKHTQAGETLLDTLDVFGAQIDFVTTGVAPRVDNDGPAFLSKVDEGLLDPSCRLALCVRDPIDRSDVGTAVRDFTELAAVMAFVFQQLSSRGPEALTKLLCQASSWEPAS